MKKQLIAIFTALIMILSMGAMSVSAADELTVTKVAAIDDYNIIVEFSDAIVLNLNGATTGPWVAIRIMDGNALLFENGNPCQIGGTCSILSDAAGNRMLFTMDSNNTVGAANVIQLLNKEGDLSRFADYDIKFCIEEIHAKIGATPKDYKVENVTTLDGTVALTATTDVEQDAHYEGCYSDIEIDTDYVLYPVEEVPEDVPTETPEVGTDVANDGGSMSFDEAEPVENEDEEKSETPSWVIPVVICAAVVFLALIAVVVLMAIKMKNLKK